MSNNLMQKVRWLLPGTPTRAAIDEYKGEVKDFIPVCAACLAHLTMQVLKVFLQPDGVSGHVDPERIVGCKRDVRKLAQAILQLPRVCGLAALCLSPIVFFSSRQVLHGGSPDDCATCNRWATNLAARAHVHRLGPARGQPPRATERGVRAHSATS